MVIVNGRDGSRREVRPDGGQVLMRGLRPLKIGVVGLCNGNAACGTCHVYVAESWLDRLPPPDEFEEEMLSELTHRQHNSRLSCQLEYGDSLRGLELTVAPRG